MADNKDADIIAEAIKFREDNLSANHQNLIDAKDDLNFIAGKNHWNEADALARKASNRALITINKIPTFLHQVVNDNLENTPSIKVHPVEDADEETAEVISGLIKHIEYASNADSCYQHAFWHGAANGFGFWRIITDWVDGTFDQEIKFEKISNIFSVFFDHFSKELDGSDAKRVLIETVLSKEEFLLEYPNATYQSFLGEWMNEKQVRIGEYYRIEEVEDSLLLLVDGQKVYKSEYKGDQSFIAKSRPSNKKIVMLYKLTASEILERTEIKCGWIPVFPCYGDVIDVDGHRYISGLVRNAKDPARLYNYFWSSAAEEIKARTATPFIVAEGQIEPYQASWNQANRTPMPYLKYKPTTYEGNLLPPPQRNPAAEFPAGMMQMAMHANDDIKATTGLFDSSLGARSNATSGRQELAQQRQGDLATAHFTDNLQKSIRHCGRCIVSMIPYYYDTERFVRIIGSDDSVSSKKVNQMLMAPIEDEKGAIKTVLNDLTVGKYDVTISTGPSYQTQRQEAAESMLSMAQSFPPLMQFAGDKVIQAMDWPNADDIAERIKRTIPPEITGSDDEEQDGQLPPEIEQALQQDHEIIQQLQSQLQALIQENESLKSGEQLELKKIEMQSQKEIKLQEMKNDSALDVAELNGAIDLMKSGQAVPAPLIADVNENLQDD